MITNTIRRIRRTPLFKENLWEISINTRGSFRDNFPNAYFLAQNVEFPPERTFTVEEDKTTRTKFYTGYENPDNVTIAFIETEDLQVTSWIEKWIDSFMTKDGSYIVGADPRVDLVVRFQKFGLSALALNLGSIGLGAGAGALGAGVVTGAVGAVAGSFIPANVSASLEGLDDTKTYTLEGCRFVSRDSWTITYESSELKLISVTMAVEKVRK